MSRRNRCMVMKNPVFNNARSFPEVRRRKICKYRRELQDAFKKISNDFYNSWEPKVSVCDCVYLSCCHMSKGQCWSLLHDEQLLFSCVSSKLNVCNAVTCHTSHFTRHMSHVKCLCWSLGHAEQLLFSCVSSKVSICNYVTCHIFHVICQMLMLILGTCWIVFVFMC